MTGRPFGWKKKGAWVGTEVAMSDLRDLCAQAN
jgi:hypothetical protein